MGVFLKDPDATVDYEIDWGAAYLAGRSIAGSRWSYAPIGTMEVLAAVTDGGVTRVTVRGGLRGQIIRLTNRISMSDGRADERTLTLRIDDR